MDTTEPKTGFRLPWSSDRRSSAVAQPSETDESAGSPQDDPGTNQEAPTVGADEALDATAADSTPTTAVLPASGPGTAPAEPAKAAGQRRSTRFLVEITKAMHAAAETARTATLDQFRAEAHDVVEEIHSRSATDSTDLKKRAEDDVAGIRDWSKAEIARVREETERRITGRKARLEVELEERAAQIEHEIESVHAQVARFETEMDRFYASLITEEDPSQFAALAASLPEPPPFELGIFPEVAARHAPALNETEPVEMTAEPAEAVAEAATKSGAPLEAAAGDEPVVADTAPEDAATPESPTAEAAAVPSEAEPTADEDPRLAALALAPDFADAEAAAAADAAETTDGLTDIGEESLAARLAGLVPGQTAAHGAHAPTDGTFPTTQVVVVGLTSVASIASFKRQLGRLDGVQTVAVSSGPEGEFVFTVRHAPEVDLPGVVSGLSGFGAKVGRVSDDVIEVTARDPES